MNTQFSTPQKENGTCAMSEPVAGTKPVSAPLMRLLWAAALVLPAFGAEGGVIYTNQPVFLHQRP
jgi:hypothetical protein